MSGPRVLVSGASVAGPALAYWLVRAGCRVTVVERFSSIRKEGQGVDVRDAARDVLKRMQIFETIRDRSSHEEGVEFIDSRNRSFARFGVDLESGEGNSPTSDIEILRGELAHILYEVTKDDVKYIFGDMVDRWDETEKAVDVHFTNGTPTTTFDLIVAADGIGSRIRKMAFGPDSTNVRPLNSYISYFSIPKNDTDNMWAKAHWATGGRVVVTRPDNQGRTRTFLMFASYDKADPRLARFNEVSRQGVSEQKALVQDLFKDAGWETPRMLAGMQDSDDFYMQFVGQVRMDRWSKGRVVAVGDAAHAVSPYAGMGTSMAFLDAYVLAGEISRQPDNLPAALESYDRVLRPHIESVQKLLPGTPWLILPQSRFGVSIVESVVWTISKMSESRFSKWFAKLFDYLPVGDVPFKLPEYEAFAKYKGKEVRVDSKI